MAVPPDIANPTDAYLNRQAAARTQQAPAAAPAPAPQATPYQAVASQATGMRPMGGAPQGAPGRPQTLNDYQNRAQQFGALRTMLGARQANPQGYAPRQQFQGGQMGRAMPQAPQVYQRPPMAPQGYAPRPTGGQFGAAQMQPVNQFSGFQNAPASGFSGGFQTRPQTEAQYITGRAFTPQATPALGAGQLNAAQLNGGNQLMAGNLNGAGANPALDEQRLLALRLALGGG